jgi:hypothetical protein
LEIYEKYDSLLKWQFFQYVSVNGRKAIEDWRKSLPVGEPKAAMDLFLLFMAKKDKWEYPDIDTIKGDSRKGLTELRWKASRVPHRLIGYQIGDHQYLLLIGCTHGDKNKYDPVECLDTAADRRNKIVKGEASICEYTLITNR